MTEVGPDVNGARAMLSVVRTCKRGHAVISGPCIECRRVNGREYMRRRRAADPEGERERLRQWTLANPERRRESSRRSKLKHREKVLMRKRLASRAWRTKNKQQIAAASALRWREASPERKVWFRRIRCKSMRKWRSLNPAKAKAARADWARNNPEREREYDSRYRARRQAAFVAPITADFLRDLMVSQRGECHYCGMALGEKKHLDHKTPLSRGGTHEPGNVCWACPPCNIGKKDKTEAEYVLFRREVA